MAELTIPRFGSVRETDPDYDPLVVRIGPRVDVLLDGKPISKVIAYNCNEGWIRRFVTDAHGKIRLFERRSAGSVREETLIGRVSVRWR